MTAQYNEDEYIASRTEPHYFAIGAARKELDDVDNSARDKRISDLELEIRYLGRLAGLSAVVIFLYMTCATWLK